MAFALQEVLTQEKMRLRNTQRSPAMATATISTQRLAALTGSPTASANDTIVITTNELRAMRNVVQPAAPASRRATQDLSSTASARRARMAQLDAQKAREAPPVLSEEDQLRQQFEQAVIDNATYRLQEQHDDVKSMNKMVQYAKAVTVRDRQLEEKKWLQARESEEEKRLDLEMEAERIKLIKHFDQREQIARAQNQRAAQTMMQQIAERANDRQRQQDQVMEEKRLMVAQMQELERKEEEANQRRLEANRKAREQLVAANAAAVRAKQAVKQEEIEEDLRVAEYIRKKAAMEAQREAELEQLRHEREMEPARLRAMQERDIDKAAQLDALRAKRHREQKDREWRQQQLEKARKEEAAVQELNEARERMRADKARRFANQALTEQEEYLQMLQWQREQVTRDQLKEQAAREADVVQKATLREQIAEHAAEKKAAYEAYLAEGREIERQRQEQKARLLRIKQAKLEEMAAIGIPSKYHAELANKRVMVDTIHYPNERELSIAAANSKAFAAESKSKA